MDINNLRLRNFDLTFSLVAAVLIFAGTFKILGDIAALVVTDDGNFAGLRDIEGHLATLVLSWVGTGGILIWILPKLFRTIEGKISVIAGVIIAFIVIAFMIRFGSTFLLGRPEFDFSLDYLDIIRNCLMGGLIIGMLKWREGQHSAQHKL